MYMYAAWSRLGKTMVTNLDLNAHDAQRVMPQLHKVQTWLNTLPSRTASRAQRSDLPE